MKNKLMALLLLVTMFVVSFAGCKSADKALAADGAKSEASTKSSTKEPATEPEVPAEVPSDEMSKISYCSWMTKGEDKFVNDNFVSLHPNIEVETISLDGSQYDTLLRTKVLANDAPDIFIVTASQRDAFAKDGFLMDVASIPAVTEVLPTVSGLDKLVFTEENALYGFPTNPNADIGPVYYNKNYFTEKGFTEPTTLEEFEALLIAIQKDGVEPIVLGGKDAWTSNFFANPWSKAFNLKRYEGLDADRKLLSGEIKMSDYYRETYTLWGDYIANGYVSPASVSLTYDQSVQYFADGKAALLAQGNWIASDENVLNTEGMDLGAFMMPIPSVDGKKYIGAQASMFLAISAKTQHPKAALALLEYWTSPEVIKEYGDTIGQPTLFAVGYDVSPVLTGVVDARVADDVITDFSGQLSKVPQGVYDETQTSMVNIVAGATVEEELERIDALFEKAKSTMTVD